MEARSLSTRTSIWSTEFPPARERAPCRSGLCRRTTASLIITKCLRTIEEVLADFGIDSAKIAVRAEWTAHGERARFSLVLPSDDRFSMMVGDGDEMRFRIEVFNSVEGSCRLMAVAGWLRFVCSNGLILGTALLQLRQQHRQQLQIEEVGRLLREALQSAGEDQHTVANWQSRSIKAGALHGMGGR